jgi:hypothetical protein
MILYKYGSIYVQYRSCPIITRCVSWSLGNPAFNRDLLASHVESCRCLRYSNDCNNCLYRTALLETYIRIILSMISAHELQWLCYRFWYPALVKYFPLCIKFFTVPGVHQLSIQREGGIHPRDEKRPERDGNYSPVFSAEINKIGNIRIK